jgi:putative membrane protein
MLVTMDVFLATLIYAGLGIVIFIVSFVLVDKLTPGELWKEIIERQNVAVAVLAGAVAIGISSIIAAAVHG